MVKLLSTLPLPLGCLWGGVICLLITPNVADAQYGRRGMEYRRGGIPSYGYRAPGMRIDVSPYGFSATSIYPRGGFPNVISAPGVAIYSSRGATLALPYLPALPIPPAVAPPRFEIPPFDSLVPGPRVTRETTSSTTAKVTLLAERLLNGATQLRRTLSMSNEESMWVGYLQPGAVESLADRLLIGAGFRNISRAEVRGLIANFDGVAANPDLLWISQSSGFRECRKGLAELLSALGEEPLPEVQPLVDGPQRSAITQPTDQPPKSVTPQTPRPPADGLLEELPAPQPDARPAAPVYRGEA